MTRPSSNRPDVSAVFKRLQEGEGKLPDGFWEGLLVGVIVCASFAFPLIALHVVLAN